MKTLRKFLLVVLALSMVQQVWASEVTHTINQGTMVYVDFPEFGPCLWKSTFVIGWETMSQSASQSAGKPAKEKQVYVIIFTLNTCSGVFGMNASGSANGGVQFRGGSALISTPILVYDVVAGANSLIQVDLTWEANGPPVNAGWRSHDLQNGTRVVSHFTGRTWSTVVTGSVGGTTVPLTQFSSLNSVNYGTITITK